MLKMLEGLGDPSEMMKHAEKLWAHLDDLAAYNPEEYRAFLRQQAAAAGVDPVTGKKKTTPKDTTDYSSSSSPATP